MGGSNKSGCSLLNTDRKTVRKQNRVLDCVLEMYALNNTHTVWINSPNLLENVYREERSIAECRFRVIRNWYGKCRMLNTKVETVLMSSRRGRNNQMRLSTIDAPNKEGRFRCRICSTKITQKCANFLEQETRLHCVTVFQQTVIAVTVSMAVVYLITLIANLRNLKEINMPRSNYFNIILFI